MSKKYPVDKRPGNELCARFSDFIATHPPEKVSRHLRCILFDYISGQAEAGLPVDFHIYLWELSDLFDLLDHAAAERARSR